MYATKVELLSPELLDLWREILAARSPEAGPLLHPEYVRAVSAVRDDVEVGVLERDGEAVGFLPFQRGRWAIARPVAGRLCDQSGAVLKPGAIWDPADFARAVGLRAIRLANAPLSDRSLNPFQDQPRKIWVIDMLGGFDAYREDNLRSGSNFIRQIESKIRKAERQVGPMRFVWHTEDSDVFETLLAWKAKQRRETGTPNVFDLAWARTLVENLRRLHVDDFEGVLSALYFGDTLAAAHFGVRTSSVVQYWVPGYNDEFNKLSPGLACMMEVAREGSRRGVVRLDLGFGEQRFKVRASNGTREVATATVRADPAVGAVLSTLDGVRSWAKESRARDLIHRTTRAVARGSYLARSLLG